MKDTEYAQAVKDAAQALAFAAEKAAEAGLIVNIEVQDIDGTQLTDKYRRSLFIVNASVSRRL